MFFSTRNVQKPYFALNADYKIVRTSSHPTVYLPEVNRPTLLYSIFTRCKDNQDDLSPNVRAVNCNCHNSAFITGQTRFCPPQINNITRWAKWIFFVIDLNLLLSCFGLSAMSYVLTLYAGPASPYTKHVLIWLQLVKFSTRTPRLPPPFFLSKYIIYLCCPYNQDQTYLHLNHSKKRKAQ